MQRWRAKESETKHIQEGYCISTCSLLSSSFAFHVLVQVILGEQVRRVSFICLFVCYRLFNCFLWRGYVKWCLLIHWHLFHFCNFTYKKAKYNCCVEFIYFVALTSIHHTDAVVFGFFLSVSSWKWIWFSTGRILVLYNRYAKLTHPTTLRWTRIALCVCR